MTYELKIIVKKRDTLNECYIPDKFYQYSLEDIEAKIEGCEGQLLCEAWSDALEFFKET